MSQLLRLKHKNFRAYNWAFQNSVSQGNHELKEDLKDLGLQKSVSQENHGLIKDLMDRGLDNQGNVHGSTFSECITHHVKNGILLHKKAIQCKITSITVSSQENTWQIVGNNIQKPLFPSLLVIFNIYNRAARDVRCGGKYCFLCRSRFHDFFCILLVSKGIAKDVAHVPLYVVPNH